MLLRLFKPAPGAMSAALRGRVISVSAMSTRRRDAALGAGNPPADPDTESVPSPRDSSRPGMDTLQAVINFFKQYGNVVSLVATWGIFVWVWRGKRSDFARKEFIDQVNFSLNYVADGKLAMRTIAEASALDIWLNDSGAGKVRRAAKRTTEARPFIFLDDEADMDFVYRAVLNVVSEQFAEAYLAQSMGLPVVSAVYRFMVTMERYGDIRTLKMRVLLVREADLETLFDPALPPEKQVQVSNAQYGARLRTLHMMHDIHKRAGEPGAMKVGRVILSLREFPAGEAA
jgi:hypothetical protein